jgi:hypothetical protein
MADLLIDSQGRPVPQYLGDSSGVMEASKGDNGGMYVIVLTALPAGTNKIGSVDIASLPTLPAGANLLGKVDVNSLPALPAGTNKIGSIDVSSLPSLPMGSNTIGTVNITPPKFLATMVTLAAGVAYTIKASAGYIARIATSLTDVIICNNTTQLWIAGGSIEFANPIYCDTSIVLISATGGSVSVEYM